MSLHQKAITGVFWTFLEMTGGQFINFFVNLILARKLFPEDYGLLGMIFIFITISQTLMDSGINTSLLRTKNPTDKDYSTLFVGNVFFSIILYLVLFLVAPLVAIFYDKPIITGMIRLYGLTIIIQAFVQVQSTYLIKNLNFKKQALMKFPAIIISSIIAIYMAYNGYGVWSLILMYLLQSFFWALFHWVFGDWKPKISFDKVLFSKHFNFGYKLTLVELLNNLSANVYQIVIGRFYNPIFVGYYTQALTLRQIPISNIYFAVMKVLFPLFAEAQDDKEKFKIYYIQNLKYLLFVLTPILFFIAIFSKEILIFLYTNKWEKASIYLTILAISGVFLLISTYHTTILKITKDSSLVLKLKYYFLQL